MYSSEIFREYDIRGIYEKQFDLDFANLLGQAYAKLHFTRTNQKNPTIAVGYDARLSSPMIFESIQTGLRKAGANVISLGMVTTPMSYYSTFALAEVNGSIMITGSHNPPDYNGFKICIGTSTLYGESIQELRQIIESNSFLQGNSKGSSKSMDIAPIYLARYKEEFGDLSGVSAVFDCGNGAAGCILRRLLEAVNIKPQILFEKPDGLFPNHHPDPTVEKNLVDLKKAVAESKAAVGIGFDGDADRIGLVDHEGRMIYGDELMVIIARDILSTTKGAKIIGDVKCSDRLFDDIKKHGGTPIMWKTGHSLIKEKVKVEKAPFGGEMSGHVFFSDRNYGYDDALYAGLRVIEIMHRTKKTIPELLAGLGSAHNTPEIRIDTTEEKKLLIVAKLREYFTSKSGLEINLLDGIRVSYPNGWALARASNTQPVLVVRYEADSAEGMNKIQGEFESIINKYL